MFYSDTCNIKKGFTVLVISLLLIMVHAISLHASDIEAVVDDSNLLKVNSIPKKKIGYFYGIISGGVGSNYFNNSSGDIISSSSGFFSGSAAGIFSLALGYEFKIHSHFHLSFDLLGRFMFFNQEIMNSKNQYSFSILNSQMLMFQIKPTVVMGEGRYGIFLSIGVGGYFSSANGINPINNSASELMSLAVSYGIGSYILVRPNNAFFINVFSFAPIPDQLSLKGQDLELNAYGLEFGLKLFV